LGRLLRPDDSGYQAAVRTFDPRRDDYRPLAVVRAADAGDIADSLTFATDHGLSPRPRSGGHSYVGASTGNGVLVIDCAGLDTISYDAGSRQVTVGAGVRLGDLHRVLGRHDRTVPTGTCPTVGAAGLTLGGGIGTETRLRGLTQDALVGATVVTPDGATHRVSAGHEPDLLWALRGGGGGNLGIVTQFSYRTYPALSGEIFRLSWPAAAAVDVLIGWQHRLAAMPTRSWANLHLDSSGGAVTPSITGIRWGGPADDDIDARRRHRPATDLPPDLVGNPCRLGQVVRRRQQHPPTVLVRRLRRGRALDHPVRRHGDRGGGRPVAGFGQRGRDLRPAGRRRRPPGYGFHHLPLAGRACRHPVVRRSRLHREGQPQAGRGLAERLPPGDRQHIGRRLHQLSGAK